ncbi:MAG: hypothetical protein R3C45_09370 [Phycisphaerales bacterium]
MSHTPVNTLPILLAGTLVLGGVVRPSEADNRKFTYSYETTTMPKGHAEYEQWVTWKTHKESDPDFDRFDFRHEIEWGVTDQFQLAVYVSDWRYEDGASVSDDGTDWRNVAVEGIYSLSDPTADAFGSAVYGEVKWGDELFVLEAKILLQKNVGSWVFAYNGTVEAEWESEDYNEEVGVFENTVGVSYQFSPKFSAGVEALHEIEYENWSDWGDDVVYAGPVISTSSDGWWLTVTQMFQLTDLEGEPDFQTRLIMGFDF